MVLIAVGCLEIKAGLNGVHPDRFLWAREHDVSVSKGLNGGAIGNENTRYARALMTADTVIKRRTRISLYSFLPFFPRNSISYLSLYPLWRSPAEPGGFTNVLTVCSLLCPAASEASAAARACSAFASLADHVTSKSHRLFSICIGLTHLSGSLPHLNLHHSRARYQLASCHQRLSLLRLGVVTRHFRLSLLAYRFSSATSLGESH